MARTDESFFRLYVYHCETKLHNDAMVMMPDFKWPPTC